MIVTAGVEADLIECISDDEMYESKCNSCNVIDSVADTKDDTRDRNETDNETCIEDMLLPSWCTTS